LFCSRSTSECDRDLPSTLLLPMKLAATVRQRHRQARSALNAKCDASGRGLPGIPFHANIALIGRCRIRRGDAAQQRSCGTDQFISN
jgi:hypothetical protein